MPRFISHPTRFYVDEDELERAAGQLEQLKETTKNGYNRTVYRCGATALRLIQTFEYSTGEDFIEDYALTCEVLPEGDGRG